MQPTRPPSPPPEQKPSKRSGISPSALRASQKGKDATPPEEPVSSPDGSEGARPGFLSVGFKPRLSLHFPQSEPHAS